VQALDDRRRRAGGTTAPQKIGPPGNAPKPASAKVGTSGSCVERCEARSASTLILPSFKLAGHVADADFGDVDGVAEQRGDDFATAL